NDFRHLHEAEINDQVAAFTRQWNAAELANTMQKRGVPCLAVNSPSGFMNEEHIQARQLFGTASHPVLGEYQQVSFPLLMDGQRQAPERPPLLGEHTREILSERLGLNVAEIELLFAQAVI